MYDRGNNSGQSKFSCNNDADQINALLGKSWILFPPMVPLLLSLKHKLHAPNWRAHSGSNTNGNVYKNDRTRTRMQRTRIGAYLGDRSYTYSNSKYKNSTKPPHNFKTPRNVF